MSKSLYDFSKTRDTRGDSKENTKFNQKETKGNFNEEDVKKKINQY